MSQPPPRRQSLAANLLLALVSVLVTLGVAELVARAVWRDPAEWQRAPVPAKWAGLHPIEGPLFLGRPHARGLNKGAYYESNSDGFRGREYSKQKPPGTFRIVLIGDSFAMGEGVLLENTYGARVERALNDRHDGRRYELLNLALSGLDANIIVRRMKSLGLRYHPDMIVYGYTLNDIEGPHYRRFKAARLQYVEAGREWSSSPSYLLRILKPRWDSLRDLVDPSPDSYIRELHYNYFQNPAAWRDLLGHLDDLAAIGRNLDVCTVLFIHTRICYLHWFHPFLPYYDAVAEAALARGFYVKRSFPAFKGQEASSLWLSPFDQHPNAEGNALMAKSLLEELKALPEACWRGK